MTKKTKKICKRAVVSLVGIAAFAVSFFARSIPWGSGANQYAKSEKSAEKIGGPSLVQSVMADVPPSGGDADAGGTADGSSGSGDGDGDGA